MNVNSLIDALVCYAINTGLAPAEDWNYLVNRLLEAMALDDYTPSTEPLPEDLETILSGLLEEAVARGLCDDNITARDLFDSQAHGPPDPPAPRGPG